MSPSRFFGDKRGKNLKKKNELCLPGRWWFFSSLPLIRWGRGIGRNFHFWLISTSRVLQCSWVMALSWFLLGWTRVDFVVFTILPNIDWNKTAHRTEFLISVCPAGPVHRGRKLLLLGAGGPYDDPGRWPFRLPVVNLWAQKSSERIRGLKCDLIVYLLQTKICLSQCFAFFLLLNMFASGSYRG